MTSFEVAEGGLSPASVNAVTRKAYPVPFDSPAMTAVVATDPVSATTGVQVTPSVLASTRYPLIGLSPGVTGTDQDRLTRASPAFATGRPGADGSDAVGSTGSEVVEYSPMPALFIAATLNT